MKWINLIMIMLGVFVLAGTLITKETSLIVQIGWILIAIIWIIIDWMKGE